MRKTLGVSVPGVKGGFIKKLFATRVVAAFLAAIVCCGVAEIARAAAPSFPAIADQTVIQDQPSYPLELNITDETSQDNLQLTGTSSDQTLVPNANIFFGMAGGEWFATVTPAFGQVGTATITLTVKDGENLTVSRSFVFTVNPPTPGAERFFNPAPITLPDQGPAGTYPSDINVSGMNGTITSLTLTLNKLSHQRVQELQLLLVAPTGEKA